MKTNFVKEVRKTYARNSRFGNYSKRTSAFHWRTFGVNEICQSQSPVLVPLIATYTCIQSNKGM